MGNHYISKIADNIARQGYDVLFFSLEISRLELISKSVIRILRKKRTVKEGRRKITPFDIMSGNIHAGPVQDILAEYQNTIGNHLSIVDGNFAADVVTLRRAKEDYINTIGTHPVVIVDYLQILQLENQFMRKEMQKGLTLSWQHLTRWPATRLFL